MRSRISHILFAIQPDNLPFYRDLFGYLGWNTIFDGHGMLGVGIESGESLWFGSQLKDVANDYDGPGMNHLGIGAESIADVDAAAAYLNERGIALLHETPRHRPEFTGSPTNTYYQIMFESPDRIQFEFVYTGPKT